VIDADGSDLRILTHRGIDNSPAWSPDGTRIAFSRDQGSAIYIMDADGSGVRRLVDAGADNLEPAWSPDGRWIAFTSGPNIDETSVTLVRPDGSGLHRIGPRGVSTGVSWPPDGSRIAFARGDDV